MCLWRVTEVGERPDRVYKVVDVEEFGLKTPYYTAPIALGERQMRWGDAEELHAEYSNVSYPCGVHCYTSLESAKGALVCLNAAAIVSSSNFGSVLAEGEEGADRVVVLDWVIWESALDPTGDR